MKIDFLSLVRTTLKEFHACDAPSQQELDVETPLYADSGLLDSFSLVSFIIALEQELGQKLGRSITLLDEKAFSSRNSPFRSVASLSNYLEAHFSEALKETTA